MTATAGNFIERRSLDLGACYLGDGQCEFRVWAPYAGRDGVHLQRIGQTAGIPQADIPQAGIPQADIPQAGIPQADIPMIAEPKGYYRLRLEDAVPGTRYWYVLDKGKTRPDPASRYQPDGVHGPSAIVDPAFDWTDSAWVNPPLEQYVFYELHTGTFEAAGTFDGIVPRLRYLKDLGVTAIELMPIAQFPGTRNWGYDGVFPYAVQNSYGGPRALKHFVNAAHEAGLAVVLDVVYNHLGPEGNYLRDFGPYFTNRYKTPWGDAINFDGPESDEVREYFVRNALYWTTECHVDALRLDAVHAIMDTSARPFVQELAMAVRSSSGAYVIAESDQNDVRAVHPDGLACDSLWSDSLHHCLHVLLTGERDGYYQDYGTAEDLAKAYSEAFTYSGQYSPFRRRRHGNSAKGSLGRQFVVCAQNHDQIGNRARGDRLSTLVDFEALKLAAGAVILSPYLPLLFMGEEYGETAPFLYFTHHGDSELIDAVKRGRREEFGGASWQEVPDPQDESNFLHCRLTPPESWTSQQQLLRDFYRELLRLRRVTPALSQLSMEQTEATPLDDRTLMVRRWCEGGESLLLLHFGDSERSVVVPGLDEDWRQVLCSSESRWGGRESALSGAAGEVRLPARSFMLYGR